MLLTHLGYGGVGRGLAFLEFAVGTAQSLYPEQGGLEELWASPLPG